MSKADVPVSGGSAPAGARERRIEDARHRALQHYRTTAGCGREHAALLDDLITLVRAGQTLVPSVFTVPADAVEPEPRCAFYPACSLDSPHQHTSAEIAVLAALPVAAVHPDCCHCDRCDPDRYGAGVAAPPDDTEALPVVEKLSTGMLHRVYAAGDAKDGSLYNFDTLCGQRIGENWEAEWREHRECERCAKVLRAGVAAPREEPDVWQEVAAERARQDAKWGGSEHDDDHSRLDWLRFITEHANKAMWPGQFRRRMIEVAALAIAAVESEARLSAESRAAVAAPTDAGPTEVERLRAQKDGAYRERDMCVALLARQAKALGCRVGMARHEGEWEDDWRWIVYIDLPTGQVSWHIHDSERDWFDFLFYDSGWDGHTTDEKYERVLRAARSGSGTTEADHG